MKPAVTAFVLLISGAPALAHHSFLASYDRNTVHEVFGEITRIEWANPHVYLSLRSVDTDGGVVTWEIEGNAKNQLERMQVRADYFRIGDSVRVAGFPARRASNRLYLGYVMLSDGREIVTQSSLSPRWSARAIGENSILTRDGTARDLPGQERGLFRVWSTNFANPESFPIWKRDYPLTESAREIRAAWDPETPILTCSSYGMPTIMNTPDPMEFVEQGERILLRLESFDIQRTIYLTEQANQESEYSPLGYSIGRWEGDTLVVTTNRIGWPHFDQQGIPQSGAVETVEYFTPAADGSRLDYRLIVTDPTTFTEPVALERYWTWHETEVLRQYADEACAG